VYLLPRKTRYKYHIYICHIVCVCVCVYIVLVYAFRHPRAEFRYVYKYIFICYLLNDNINCLLSSCTMYGHSEKCVCGHASNDRLRRYSAVDEKKYRPPPPQKNTNFVSLSLDDRITCISVCVLQYNMRVLYIYRYVRYWIYNRNNNNTILYHYYIYIGTYCDCPRTTVYHMIIRIIMVPNVIVEFTRVKIDVTTN